jgi:hypothetical protein
LPTPELLKEALFKRGLIILAIAGWPVLVAQTSSAPAPAADGSVLKVRHLIGLGDVKSQDSGKLSVQDGALIFDTGKLQAKVPVSSIDDIFLGSESTQSGGKAGRVVKTAAIAAPFESGKVLSLIMLTKVDVLTIQYRDSNGGVHGAILATPKGTAAGLRTQLIAAGAHASPLPDPPPQKEGK